MPVESRERAILVVQHEHWLRKLISNLQRLGIDNLSAFEKRIRSVIGFRGEFEDSLFEGKFPIGVRRHIDQIQAIRFYPTGKKKGPDYELGFGQQTIFVEFTRFREDEDLFKSLQIKEDQTELSQIPYGYEQIWNKITKKLDQLVKGEINIIVLYSAHDAREALDFRIVVSKYLAHPANAYLLKHLSGVLFTDKWSTPPEFWVNGRAERVFPSGLIELFRTAIYDFKAVALE